MTVGNSQTLYPDYRTLGTNVGEGSRRPKISCQQMAVRGKFVVRPAGGNVARRLARYEVSVLSIQPSKPPTACTVIILALLSPHGPPA